jgi:hypothetical protein
MLERKEASKLIPLPADFHKPFYPRPVIQRYKGKGLKISAELKIS